MWAELWSLPQAVAWEELHLQRVVARYAQKLVQAEKRDASAALQSEVRQLEDRLGLSALSMLRLKWEIGGPSVPAMSGDDGPAEVTDLDEYRRLYGG